MSNAYLDKRTDEINSYIRTAERVTRQFDVDSWQIALARYSKLDLGFQRIMEITAIAEQVRAEYDGAIIQGPETDVYRHHLDAELQSIAKGHMTVIPFERRYPELKKQTYEGRRKKHR